MSIDKATEDKACAIVDAFLDHPSSKEVRGMLPAGYCVLRWLIYDALIAEQVEAKSKMNATISTDRITQQPPI